MKTSKNTQTNSRIDWHEYMRNLWQEVVRSGNASAIICEETVWLDIWSCKEMPKVTGEDARRGTV